MSTAIRLSSTVESTIHGLQSRTTECAMPAEARIGLLGEKLSTRDLAEGARQHVIATITQCLYIGVQYGAHNACRPSWQVVL